MKEPMIFAREMVDMHGHDKALLEFMYWVKKGAYPFPASWAVDVVRILVANETAPIFVSAGA